jgi:very-short-patch-repair endonuclease
VDVSDWLHDLGGVARRGTLLRLVGRAELDRAVSSGLVVRDARGVYALRDADVALRAGARVGGVVGLTSAALRHGWAVARVPSEPFVIVSRGRKISSPRSGIRVVVSELGPHDACDGATVPRVTLEQCLRHLPFDEALAVADSALREGFPLSELAELARRARGPGSRQIQRVAAAADPRAANPFESVLRAICLDVPGLDVVPQVVISDAGFTARVDLADRRLRLVIEADSFEWHGKRSALASDARRYNRLVVLGFLVLRFSYEDAMYHSADVHRTLVEAVALAELLREQARRAASTA